MRSALASAYLRCVNGGKEVREGSRTIGVDLERLFVDTAISSISANPPDLSLSNKLWCIIDLRECDWVVGIVELNRRQNSTTLRIHRRDREWRS